MNFSVYGVFLFKDLFYDRGRSILTLVSLTAVIVSYLAASAISDVFQEYGSLPQTGSRDLLIMSDYALEPMQSKLDNSVLQTAAELVHQEFGPASVSSVFPVIYRTLEINDRTMQVLAVPGKNLRRGYGLTLLEGNWPESDEEVVVTQEGIELNGWHIADHILILRQQSLDNRPCPGRSGNLRNLDDLFRRPKTIQREK